MKVINKNIPVVMFHSLKYNINDNFYLSTETDLFVETIHKLLGRGFSFITIEEILKGEHLPEKSVCFTFDDGFADNYDVLFPIIQYYGIKVTIFPSIDFINVDSTQCHSKDSGEHLRRYLSKDEIIKMHNSGLVDFQGHSKTHTWYEKSGKVLNTVNKDNMDKHVWLYWNAFPEKKNCVSREMLEDYFKNDHLLLENSRALNCRKFIPSSSLFDTSRKKIDGKYESIDEQTARYEEELIWSKQYLEDLLDKEISFLCWPGGEMDELSYKVFLRSKYSACSVPSNTKKKKVAERLFNQDQPVISRISASFIYKGHNLGAEYLVNRIDNISRYGDKTKIRNAFMARKLYLKTLLASRSAR